MHISRGHGNTRIGLKEISGSYNNPTSVRFTNGSTPEYEAAISLNDASSCVRFTPGGLGDESCNKLYNFTCMSDPIDKGILFILSGEFRTSQRVAPTRKGAPTYCLTKIKTFMAKRGGALPSVCPLHTYLFTLQEHHKFLTNAMISITSDFLLSM